MNTFKKISEAKNKIEFGITNIPSHSTKHYLKEYSPFIDSKAAKVLDMKFWVEDYSSREIPGNDLFNMAITDGNIILYVGERSRSEYLNISYDDLENIETELDRAGIDSSIGSERTGSFSLNTGRHNTADMLKVYIYIDQNKLSKSSVQKNERYHIDAYTESSLYNIARELTRSPRIIKVLKTKIVFGLGDKPGPWDVSYNIKNGTLEENNVNTPYIDEVGHLFDIEEMINKSTLNGKIKQSKDEISNLISK